jgi:hypothetical protein
MNSLAITTAIAAIEDGLYKIATGVLEDDAVGMRTKSPFKNTLQDSQLKKDLYAAQVSTSGDIVIEALFNNYVVYLEWDRPKEYGKRPPIDALKGWAEKNGIPTDASTLWAISNAIWRDGHKGRPIFATMDALVDTAYGAEWSDTLFNSITVDLDNLFND